MEVELGHVPTEVELVRRAAIQRLQEAIQGSGLDLGVDPFPLIHHFAPGMYGREILVPAGAVVIGKIHKEAHLNVLSHGTCMVYTEQEGVLTLKAPYTFTSKPGAKRAVLALTDVVWTTIHRTDSTDLAEIEREVIASDYKELT